MSLTDQPAAYRDCYDLFDRALASIHGVRTPFRTESQAKLFQLRMNQARSIIRKQSKRIYPPTNKLYDTSEYDGYQCQIRGPDVTGEYWLYVRPHGITIDYVEELEPDQPMLGVSEAPPSQLQLTHQTEDLPE